MASGTARTGFVTEDLGPFKCVNCEYFEMRGACNQPNVMDDPEVAKNKDGTGAVRPNDLCHEFTSVNQSSQSFQPSSRKEMLVMMFAGRRKP